MKSSPPGYLSHPASFGRSFSFSGVLTDTGRCPLRFTLLQQSHASYLAPIFAHGTVVASDGPTSPIEIVLEASFLFFAVVIDMDFLTRPPDDQPCLSPMDAHASKRKLDAKPGGTPTVTKKPRAGDDLVHLPMSCHGTLQYKTKHQILHQYSDCTYDVVLSRDNANEINFYAPRADKLGDNFAGLADATDEALTALIKTIKAEIAPQRQGKLISFNFAIVSEDEHHISNNNIHRAVEPQFRRPNWEAVNIDIRPASSSDIISTICGTPSGFDMKTEQLTPIAVASNQSAIPDDDIFSPPTDQRGPASSQNTLNTSSIKSEQIGVETAAHAAPGPFDAGVTKPPGDSVLPSVETPEYKHPGAGTSTTTTSDQCQSAILPSLTRSNIPNELLCEFLQKQWPSLRGEFDIIGPFLSTLGCLVTVYRNIIRSLILHVEPPRSVKEVYQLGASFKGVQHDLWKYLWLDMETPTTSETMRTEFRTKTCKLIKKLIDDPRTRMLSTMKTEHILHSRKSSIRVLAWQFCGRLRLLMGSAFSTLHSFKNPTARGKRLPSLAEAARLESTTPKTVNLKPEHSKVTLQDVINKRFQCQYREGHGVFTPHPTRPYLRAICAFPAVIRVHYKSIDAVPKHEYSTDWFVDGPGRTLRGFSVLQEKWNIKAVSAQRREQNYRLMAVVRMRNTTEELDLVRVYSDVGECLSPPAAGNAGQNLIYHCGNWSLSEPNREFMLYYTPCAYNAQFSTLFPERYANVD
ncbi:hypothetical protein V8F33_003269 [Rhypophila sp. PSN 637]